MAVFRSAAVWGLILGALGLARPAYALRIDIVFHSLDGEHYTVEATADVLWFALSFGVSESVPHTYKANSQNFMLTGSFVSSLAGSPTVYDHAAGYAPGTAAAPPGARCPGSALLRCFDPGSTVLVGWLTTRRPLTPGTYPLTGASREIADSMPAHAYHGMMYQGRGQALHVPGYVTVTTSGAVPEPRAFALLGSGIAALLFLRRREAR